MFAFDVGAAPHCPTGHFSPYSDGEKEAVADDFASRQPCRTKSDIRDSLLLPVTIRGEGAGRRMRGGANIDWLVASTQFVAFRAR
ncbi:hypothetical protein FJV76_03215 [Mesorhizobium sp. WSM4303]|nr:hypothetical protein FJV77_21465 [Mesorhizobium sp. WSM4306]TRD08652.1 hypothetical protein FJV76_03215 [Mesorhizobium sp. WSM4303]